MGIKVGIKSLEPSLLTTGEVAIRGGVRLHRVQYFLAKLDAGAGEFVGVVAGGRRHFTPAQADAILKALKNGKK